MGSETLYLWWERTIRMFDSFVRGSLGLQPVVVPAPRIEIAL
jgi:hypothetical protein|nr:hypothetical protein [Dietzia maris]